MANRSVTAHAKQRNKEVQIQAHETDAPIIPIAAIERLHQIRPDKVDWLFEQTAHEAEHRRCTDTQVNRYVFIERMAGLLLSLLIGAGGIGATIYVALQGHDWVAGTIATVSMGTLAVAYLKKPAPAKPDASP